MKNSILHMRPYYLIASLVTLASLTLTGCSLFPSDSSRPVTRYPAQPAPAYPAPPVPGNPGPDTSVTSSPVGDGGTDIIKQIALDEAACKAAHGHWNACASPCRNQPDAKVCIESCMMVCECGGIAGFGCPAGYECGDYVPGPNVPDAMGICKPTAVKPTTTSKEFNNPKTFTSVVVIGSVTDGHVTVSNPFSFYGTTTVFENQFSWRVKDGKDVAVASGQAYANSPDMGQPGPFKVAVNLKLKPATKTGFLELFDNSPKDGAEEILISVPITFALQP